MSATTAQRLRERPPAPGRARLAVAALLLLAPTSLRLDAAQVAAGIASPPPEQQTPQIQEVRVSRAEYFGSPWLDEPAALPVVGRLVGVVGEPTHGGRLTTAARRFDDVYLTYDGGRPQIGDRLLLVRPGRRVERAGSVIEPVAIGLVVALHAQVMTVRLMDQLGRVLEGDLAIPLPPFEPVAGGMVDAEGPFGHLLGFEREQALYGPAARGFVSLGEAHGLAVGDELLVYRPPRGARSGAALPGEAVATLRVVKTSADRATVRVLRLMNPLLEPGLPVMLVRKVQ